MNFKSILLTSLVFLIGSVVAADSVSVGLRSQHLINLSHPNNKVKNVTISGKCSDQPSINNLANAQDPHLRKLDEYQTVCKSLATRTMMIFSDMPKDETEAQDMAKKMAITLKEFDKYGVQPLVIMEPVASWGDVDFSEFKNGLYDTWIDDYFKDLKDQNISDKQMGVWVSFPEPNLPYWNHQSATPADFPTLITKYVGYQKKYFPTSKASIMLNSATYDNKDFDWKNEEYISLLPYVKGIPKGLLDSFGFQGFPWAPRARSGDVSQYDASHYLNTELAQEAADAIGVKKIWFNTGTFMQKYTLDKADTVTVDAGTRKEIWGGIINEVSKLQTKGYEISVNIFAQDKSQASEETNWSYWPAGQPLASDHAIVFNNVVSEMNQRHIGVWLFDT